MFAERNPEELGFDVVLSAVIDGQEVYGAVDLDVGDLSSTVMDTGAHFSIDGIDIHLTVPETQTIESIRKLLRQTPQAAAVQKPDIANSAA